MKKVHTINNEAYYQYTMSDYSYNRGVNHCDICSARNEVDEAGKCLAHKHIKHFTCYINTLLIRLPFGV